MSEKDAQTDQTADWIAMISTDRDIRAFAMRGAQTLDARDMSVEGDGESAVSRVADLWSPNGGVPILACGGLFKAAYRKVPCLPMEGPLVQTPQVPNLYVVPGIAQEAPPAAMQGQETAIAGFLALNAGWDGVLCLPGRSTIWAEVSADEVVSFQSFLSGDLVELLTRHSALRDALSDQAWDDDAFGEALSDVMSRPERFGARLSELGASDLLHGPDRTRRARLCGYVLGAEFAAARAYWLGRQIALLGDGGLTEAYAAAFAAQGTPVIRADATRMALAGLTKAYRAFRDAGIKPVD